MKRALLMITLAPALVAAGYALGRRSVDSGPLDGPAPSGPTIASFDGGALSSAEVEAMLAAQPEIIRTQLRSPAARKALVEAMVRTEVLARAAEARGLQRQPAFLRRYKDELGRALVEQEVEAPQRKSPPSEAEVRAFFDEHQGKLGRPERARVAVVAWAAGKDDAPARSAKRARAQAALARLQGARKDPEAFARIARAESDDAPSKLTNGELPFLTRDELAGRFGAPVADAAFGLRTAGELAPAVIESDTGLYVVKLLGREEGYAPVFDELKQPIRSRLAEERRVTAEKAFLDRLVKAAGVRLDERAIEAMEVR